MGGGQGQPPCGGGGQGQPPCGGGGRVSLPVHMKMKKRLGQDGYINLYFSISLVDL